MAGEGGRRRALEHRSRRDISDEGGGVIDLRPGDSEDSELRRLIIGRAAKLERLGWAEKVGPAQWTLKPGLEPASRGLGTRGAIIKAMHRAVPEASQAAIGCSRGGRIASA